MTILNLMLSAKRGGLEQAAIDYAQALQLAGVAHCSIVAPHSWAHQQFQQLGLPHATLTQRGGYDLLAAWRLRRLVRQRKASAMICHGNRALSLGLRARATKIIAVAHNYKTKRFAKGDACFAITHHALDRLAQAIPRNRLHWMPNMVRIAPAPPRGDLRMPPVIGSMGRFVAKKGYPLLVEAIALLHRQGVAVRAVIGGGGEDEAALRALIAAHRLEEAITLPGWVEDKAEFFAAMDLFVLPSHHEPFGIVLIEAMAQGVPVISTQSEGPGEILQHDENGLLTPLNDAAALAEAIRHMIDHPTDAARLGQEGRRTVEARYTPDAMAARLSVALQTIITGN